MLRLCNVNYSEFENTPQEWRLDGLSLADSNLIVGKNSSGKSRALNVIRGLARHLSGIDSPRISGTFDVKFINDGKKIDYKLKFKDWEVVEESFAKDRTMLLERGSGGKGTIFATALGDNGEFIQFQTPPSELAVVARRDTIQHNYLEPLFNWGDSFRHYFFGTQLGKDHFNMIVKEKNNKVDELDSNNVVALYRQAKKEFPDKFNRAVISDMNKVGYDLKVIGAKPPVTIHFKDTPGEVVGLYVKEKELLAITDQPSMSQGMFRSLSLLIQINYSQMKGKSTCLAIDDIGEGLDFERSCKLIDLLREKTTKSNTQLIMTTNDRFVMNRVPLEEWSIIQREGSHVKVLNYSNSKDIFEEFKFTGLSNFSFLEMDFASGSTNEEMGEDE